MAKRIFYASHAVAVAPAGNAYATIQGAQSVSVNTNFNLEQVFQLGRLAIYDNIAVDPDVEVTVSKALDSYATIWSLATGGGSLVSRANTQTNIRLGIGEDTNEVLNANIATIEMTGCYVSSLNYTFPVDGNFTEEITFVGSHKAVGAVAVAAPAELLPTDKVLRRQNFRRAGSTLPSEIGTKKLSQITISADLNREKMFQLGAASPFHRFVNFPLEITVAFDVISDGTTPTGPAFNENFAPCSGFAINRQPIVIGLCAEGAAGVNEYSFDLGSGCSLQSVSYSGGDTGGGNVTETYTYITYNTLTITG